MAVEREHGVTKKKAWRRKQRNKPSVIFHDSDGDSFQHEASIAPLESDVMLGRIRTIQKKQYNKITLAYFVNTGASMNIAIKKSLFRQAARQFSKKEMQKARRAMRLGLFEEIQTMHERVQDIKKNISRPPPFRKSVMHGLF